MPCSLSKRLRTHRKKIFRNAGGSPLEWPSFQGDASFVGASPSGRVEVFVDASLPRAALTNAQDLLADADRIVKANDALFGTTGGPVQVILFALSGATDGTGGADHMGCDYDTGAQIEVCVSYNNSTRCSALFEAELSECSMSGQLCGLSTGEALSRWCAMNICGNVLPDFKSAPDWANNGKPDWVNKTNPTDQDHNSTGCGMAFISWLLSQGYDLDAIAPLMVAYGNSGTLAHLYAQLTSQPENAAWPMFITAVDALPHGITTDDPFAGSAPIPPKPQPPQPTVPTTVEDQCLAFVVSLGDSSDTGKLTSRQIAVSLVMKLYNAGLPTLAQAVDARLKPILS